VLLKLDTSQRRHGKQENLLPARYGFAAVAGLFSSPERHRRNLLAGDIIKAGGFSPATPDNSRPKGRNERRKMPERRKMSRQYTKAQMRAFSRDRLENPAPMEHSPGPEGSEVLRIGNTSRLVEHVPAKLEITDLDRFPSYGPFRVWTVDDFDSDFRGGTSEEYLLWSYVMKAVNSLAVGHRLYVDDRDGRCILRAVHHPAQTLHPW
jgi:hypothetical protein